jgi:hypothetical protein
LRQQQALVGIRFAEAGEGQLPAIGVGQMHHLENPARDA